LSYEEGLLEDSLSACTTQLPLGQPMKTVQRAYQGKH